MSTASTQAPATPQTTTGRRRWAVLAVAILACCALVRLLPRSTRPRHHRPTREPHVKPIGYWLNRTDKALTTSMNAVLAEFGLTRPAWQVLNVVGDDPQATDTGVLTVLAANADVTTLTEAIGTAVADGWAIRPEPGRVALTDDGRARLAEVGERVDAFRELSTAGITGEEYRLAVTVLERMTYNLENGAER
ncbi:MarR family winged helix-turn-helix transcriptional regulator [Kitasatospora sp. NPDC048545]|uniref:MarR family winged helix-turn-helix transcriptional regulator n=1 Tax=Kitasatospora sp. NPDC048545 TaxID=3157208 RepID=UPI0033C49722